jgi:hypothetical protein
VTSVGGTSLTLNASGAASSETVWNNDSGASGGGASVYFNRPYWQAGNGVSGSARLVPDVASAADPYTGAVMILGGTQTIIGGTSWSSPTWAGFCALINQDRSNHSLPRSVCSARTFIRSSARTRFATWSAAAIPPATAATMLAWVMMKRPASACRTCRFSRNRY